MQALREALLERVSAARGPALEWGRLRRGAARVLGWLGANRAVLADDYLPPRPSEGGEEGGEEGGADTKGSI